MTATGLVLLDWLAVACVLVAILPLWAAIALFAWLSRRQQQVSALDDDAFDEWGDL